MTFVANVTFGYTTWVYIRLVFLPQNASAHSEVPSVAAEGDTSQQVPVVQNRLGTYKWST